MSRSLFARRFTEMLGNTPMDYVAEVRMRHATSLMREHGLSPSQVATRVGYQSPAAFSRAYRRVTGRPPGAARTTPGG
jgi:AraC-like DNA-binding protein